MQTSTEINFVLNKLATDDAFRERLVQDPTAALADLGIALQPDQVPAIRTLPSKESIAADKVLMERMMETTNSMFPFLLSGNA